MSAIYIYGSGAVTPAGWGLAALSDALNRGQPIATKPVERPGNQPQLRARTVPPPSPRPSFLAHPRLRRASPIVHYTVAAALEALNGSPLPLPPPDRMGLVFCTVCGSMRYTNRFFAETLADPATASPLVFPETVFNSPASHLAAYLGHTGVSYTLLGDQGVFLQGLATAAHWLNELRVDACLVVAAEETDWTMADALHLFSRRAVPSEGAAAFYLRRLPAPHLPALPCLAAVTSQHLYAANRSRLEAARAMRAELPPARDRMLLVDGRQGAPRFDQVEETLWRDWPFDRQSPKCLLGEGLAAAAGWQCVAAVQALARGTCTSALVSSVGCNQQAIGALFEITDAKR